MDKPQIGKKRYPVPFIVLAMIVFSMGLCCLTCSIAGFSTIPATNALVNRIQQATCTITSNEILTSTIQIPSTDADGNTTYFPGSGYKPSISFVMHTKDEKNYTIQDYSEGASYDSVAQDAKNITDKYQVGKSYPCWYDPQHPYAATLIYDYEQEDYAFSCPILTNTYL